MKCWRKKWPFRSVKHHAIKTEKNFCHPSLQLAKEELLAREIERKISLFNFKTLKWLITVVSARCVAGHYNHSCIERTLVMDRLSWCQPLISILEPFLAQVALVF